MNKALLTSNKSDWATPQWIVDYLASHLGFRYFDLDVCASKENSKCTKFYSKDQDAMTQPWEGDIWMNPPYGSDIVNWVQKANEEAENGNCTVVALLPARTDTKWFWDHCKHHSIIFLKGRIKFGGNQNSAPFPSCIVIFKKRIFSKSKITFLDLKKIKTEDK